MAVIREDLVIGGNFTAVFSAYLNLGRQLAASLRSVTEAQDDFTDAASEGSDALEDLAGNADRAADNLGDMGGASQDAADSAGDAADAQRDLNDAMQDGASAADSLAGKLKGLLATYLSFQGLQSMFDWAGGLLEQADGGHRAETQLRAVLANMGAQPVSVAVDADTTQVMSAFDAISQKANEISEKGIYSGGDLIAGAAEFATYFEDANAIASMMDTLADYAMGMSGGGSLDTAAMVNYATNLGKIMSGAYDAMSDKGFKFTEAQKAIIEGTATEKQIVEALGQEYLDMSADMQAAAAINSIIAESWGGLYETMSSTPEGKIIRLQNRFGDLQETLGNGIYPAVLKLVDVIESHFPQIEQIMTGLAYGCSLLIEALAWVADAAMRAYQVIVDNSDLVMAVLAGIGAGLIVVGVQAAVAGAKMAAAAVQSAAAWAAANWPLLLIAGSVALIIYQAREMGATWEEICGVIGGVLYELYAVIYNIIADVWNLLVIFAEFFVNLFDGHIGAVVRLVFDAFDWILSIVETVASAIDAVFGSSFAEAVNGFRSDISQWTKDTFGENEIKFERMEKKYYDNAWEIGTGMGEDAGRFLDNFSLDDFLGGAEEKLKDFFDYDELLESSGINNSLSDISADTKAIKNSVALSEEDIKLLVDMATREYVNNINLTAQTPIINVTGQNTGDTELDRRAIGEAIKEILIEEAASHTDQSYT